MHKYSVNRPAIAMIELIFAIVIIGITLMSAPMLMQQAAKSSYVAIQQEGINEASTKVSMIMGYHWDEMDANESILDTILNTWSSTPGLSGTVRRVGTPKESYRSYLDSNGHDYNATPSASLGSDSTDTFKDDIDDFIGSVGLILEGTGTGANYIEKNVTITTGVFYISDAPTTGSYNSNTLSFNPDFSGTEANSTNIKRISVTLTSADSSPDELDKQITFHAFSCNIGGYRLEERSFQ
ncbi:MAG TPA: type II secretion system protein [Epsilonproteobacteria bacterium]|nr:type II secretion system protein [Campylobacterota bacterium]